MWLLVIIGIALLWFGLIWFGFLPPLNAEALIHIQKGGLLVKRGQLRSHAKDSIIEILRDAGVQSGFIAIITGPRVKFSRNIPTAIRQRLRNILLNQ